MKQNSASRPKLITPGGGELSCRPDGGSRTLTSPTAPGGRASLHSAPIIRNDTGLASAPHSHRRVVVSTLVRTTINPATFLQSGWCPWRLHHTIQSASLLTPCPHQPTEQWHDGTGIASNAHDSIHPRLSPTTLLLTALHAPPRDNTYPVVRYMAYTSLKSKDVDTWGGCERRRQANQAQADHSGK